MEIAVRRIHLCSGTENPDEEGSYGTDVIVVLTNGLKYAASFVAFSELEMVREKHLQSGEFLNGSYYWGPNLVLVEECLRETVEKVVDHMIEEGDFQAAFKKL